MTKKYAWCKGFVDGYENKAEKHHIYEVNFKQGVRHEYANRAYNDGIEYERKRLNDKYLKESFSNKPVVYFPDNGWISLSTYFNVIKECTKAGKSNPYKKNERL